jgi:hypothetical protein
MKLRIHADSIRLRLKQGEVKTLVEGGEVTESCPTVPLPLVYALRPDPAASALSVSHAGGRLTVHLPSAWLPGWDADDRVGFSGNEEGLEILVEKDWKCAHPASEKDNADCFANPELDAS